jgi:hypothetical protein
VKPEWLAAGAALLLVAFWALQARARRLKRAKTERGQLLASAHTWGVVPVAGESTEALRVRVDAAARQNRSADPIETAKRALRAQREVQDRTPSTLRRTS